MPRAEEWHPHSPAGSSWVRVAHSRRDFALGCPIAMAATSACSVREVRERLGAACNTTDVDASWRIWSKEAEASLVRAYHTAGGPALAGSSSFIGRGHLSLRTGRLGGRCKDRIYRTDHADEFDVTNSGFFVNSSFALALRFRRRFISVCNVLKGIKTHRFTDARMSALRAAVAKMGAIGTMTSFEPWKYWIPPPWVLYVGH